MFTVRWIVWIFVAAILSTTAVAEEVCIKYHKCIPLDQFDCKSETRSSVVQRTCYAAPKRYLVIWLGKKNVAYHYCDVTADIVSKLRKAESMGRYYNGNIKVSSNDGKFDCRKHPIPEF